MCGDAVRFFWRRTANLQRTVHVAVVQMHEEHIIPRFLHAEIEREVRDLARQVDVQSSVGDGHGVGGHDAAQLTHRDARTIPAVAPSNDECRRHDLGSRLESEGIRPDGILSLNRATERERDKRVHRQPPRGVSLMCTRSRARKSNPA